MPGSGGSTALRVTAVAALVVAAACGSGADSGTTGQITVRLADAACSDVAAADVWISQVYVVGGSDSTNPHYVITDVPQQYDLLDLRNGVTATLGSATIPTGSYTQMRMIVDSGRVTLGNGLLFAGGSSASSMKVPSGGQTGIKVNFSGPVQITAGETVLLVDFDVCRSFVFTGPPSAPNGVNFKPVLHATVQDVAGSITGTAGPAGSQAMVYAIVGTDTLASAAADAVSGAYILRYLSPGTYTVGASAAGYQSGSVNNIVVGNAQNVTGVDLTLNP